MRGLFIIVAILLGNATGLTQVNNTNVKPRKIELKRINSFNPAEHVPDLEMHIFHSEAPLPGGDSYRSFLMRQKMRSRELYPAAPAKNRKKSEDLAPDPFILKSFMKYRITFGPEGNRMLPESGGVPLDNTIAVSNSGILLSSVNSYLWGYDLNADTALFKNDLGHTNNIGFKSFAGDSISPSGQNTSPFDPRLLYDPVHDRFVFVFIDGRDPDDSQIVIGVSSSSNPHDPWTVYAVTGNPREANEWTDFPAIAVTRDELFLTVNQIEDGVSWQEGFRGSLIWQIDLKALYAGNTRTEALLWDDIKYDGRYIRNLLPVKGAEGPEGPGMYFLSNRNFDLKNDTVFVVEVTNTAASGEASLNIEAGVLDEPYGLAPNGRQANTPEGSQDTLGLQTNDARWLGGRLYKDQIQFVGNTKNFETGLAAVYHGTIENVTGERTYTGHIIGSDSLDFGYPDLAYTGTTDCDNTFIITFDHTSPAFHPGVSAMYYNHNSGLYSKRITVKAGEGYVNRLFNTEYERWGDYIGIQRLYNEPGRVYLGGFYGLENNNSNTWFAKMSINPDESKQIAVEIDTAQSKALNECEVTLSAHAYGGTAPYTYFWNGTSDDSVITFNGCDGEMELRIIDDWNCEVSRKGSFASEKGMVIATANVFPNPAQDRFTLNFEVSEEADVTAYLIDMTGKIVHRSLNTRVYEGNNRLVFNTRALTQGVYEVVVESSGKVLIQERLVKIN